MKSEELWGAEYDEEEIDRERQLRGHISQVPFNVGEDDSEGEEDEEFEDRAPLMQSELDRPLCPKCHKPHRGECLVGSNRCYRCGEVGHIAFHCTKSAGRDQVQGRVFSLTKEGINPESSNIPDD